MNYRHAIYDNLTRLVCVIEFVCFVLFCFFNSQVLANLALSSAEPEQCQSDANMEWGFPMIAKRISVRTV